MRVNALVLLQTNSYSLTKQNGRRRKNKGQKRAVKIRYGGERCSIAWLFSNFYKHLQSRLRTKTSHSNTKGALSTIVFQPNKETIKHIYIQKYPLMSNEDDKHGNNLTTKHLINKNLDLLKPQSVVRPLTN